MVRNVRDRISKENTVYSTIIGSVSDKDKVSHDIVIIAHERLFKSTLTAVIAYTLLDTHLVMFRHIKRQ